MVNARFTLNVPNGLGERVIDEASKTGRNKQAMWAYMAEQYFEYKYNDKKEFPSNFYTLIITNSLLLSVSVIFLTGIILFK